MFSTINYFYYLCIKKKKYYTQDIWKNIEKG